MNLESFENMPSVSDIAMEMKENPQAFKAVLEKNPKLLDMIMSGGTGEVKYIRLSKDDQRRLAEAKENGIAEGVLIGLGVALLFAIVGDLFK